MKLCGSLMAMLFIVSGIFYYFYSIEQDNRQLVKNEVEMLSVVKYVDDNYRIVKYEGNGKMYWQSLICATSHEYWVMGAEYTE